MNKFFNTVKNVFKIKELRRRLMYTILFVVIYRFGSFVVLPWIDLEKLKLSFAFQDQQNMLDVIRGKQNNSCSIFSLGISPYISASILVQLASFLFSYFQRLQQEGMAGRSKLNRISRQLTLMFVLVQGIPTLRSLSPYFIDTDQHGIYWFYGFSLLLMMAGTMFCVWLADAITEKGLGNGTSVLIMVGVIAKLPRALKEEVTTNNTLFLVIEMIVLFCIVVIIITFMQGTRRINLQYARQMISAYSYKGTRQYLPIKLNATGVMPIIFSSVFLGVVEFMARKISEIFNIGIATSIYEVLSNTLGWKFSVIQALLIFVSTFMYAAVFINPWKIANELKRNNGFISGVKPGRPTAEYIDRIVTKILFPGAIFLSLVTILPSIVASKSIGVTESFSLFYGGTAMLIITGVFLEMAQQAESHLNMLYYDKMMEKSADFSQI